MIIIKYTGPSQTFQQVIIPGLDRTLEFAIAEILRDETEIGIHRPRLGLQSRNPFCLCKNQQFIDVYQFQTVRRNMIGANAEVSTNLVLLSEQRFQGLQLVFFSLLTQQAWEREHPGDWKRSVGFMESSVGSRISYAGYVAVCKYDQLRRVISSVLLYSTQWWSRCKVLIPRVFPEFLTNFILRLESGSILRTQEDRGTASYTQSEEYTSKGTISGLLGVASQSQKIHLQQKADLYYSPWKFGTSMRK